MKFRFAVLLSLILLTASSRGMAGKNPPHPIRLHVDVTLNGAQVPEGVYDLTWDSNSSAVRVTLRKDGQFIATAPGVWVKNGANRQPRFRRPTHQKIAASGTVAQGRPGGVRTVRAEQRLHLEIMSCLNRPTCDLILPIRPPL
jgi:hypothetical protein